MAGFPDSVVVSKKADRGTFKSTVVAAGVYVFSWMDTKVVNFLSTKHGIPEDGDSVQLKRGRGKKATLVAAPPVAEDYNRSMGGVDTADQLRRYYSTLRKFNKWWVHVFLWALDTIIGNSYQLYKSDVDRSTC